MTGKLILLLILCLMIVGAAGLLFAKPSLQNSAPAGSLEGKWEGQLGSGANTLHITLQFTKLADNSVAGQLNAAEQGVSLPISAVRFDNNKIHFEITPVGGVYDGEMNSAGTDFSGTWIQTGVPAQTLNFHRAAAAPPQQPPASTTSSTPATPPAKPLSLPFDVSIPIAPTAFAANGKMHLVYELHVTNYGGSDCSLTHLDIISGGSEESVASFPRRTSKE